jgi:hypothetical protein
MTFLKIQDDLYFVRHALEQRRIELAIKTNQFGAIKCGDLVAQDHALFGETARSCWKGDAILAMCWSYGCGKRNDGDRLPSRIAVHFVVGNDESGSLILLFMTRMSRQIDFVDFPPLQLLSVRSASIQHAIPASSNAAIRSSSVSRNAAIYASRCSAIFASSGDDSCRRKERNLSGEPMLPTVTVCQRASSKSPKAYTSAKQTDLSIVK